MEGERACTGHAMAVQTSEAELQVKTDWTVLRTCSDEYYICLFEM